MNSRQIEREHENIDRAVERGEMTPEEARRDPQRPASVVNRDRPWPTFEPVNP
jgi:hypothetical protein